MRWLTRERILIDRVACPWLIRRFIDPQPEFLFVPEPDLRTVAARTGATQMLTLAMPIYEALYAWALNEDWKEEHRWTYAHPRGWA